MTILETQEVAPAHAEGRAVFVTDDDRRARRLRRVALAVTVVACLWLVALGLGMFGFGRLPGLPFVKSGGSEPSKVSSRASAPTAAAAGWAARLDTAVLARTASRVAGGAASSASRSSSAPVTRPGVQPVAAPPPAAQAQTPANPAGRERGWAKNGNPAPRARCARRSHRHRRPLMARAGASRRRILLRRRLRFRPARPRRTRPRRLRRPSP